MTQIYKARFRPYYAKRKINRLAVVTKRTKDSICFKEVTEDGSDRLRFNKRKKRYVRNYFTLLKRDVELKSITGGRKAGTSARKKSPRRK